MTNCDLQVVLDEEQAIQYSVKYASQPEKASHYMKYVHCSLIPPSYTSNNPNAPENEISEAE